MLPPLLEADAHYYAEDHTEREAQHGNDEPGLLVVGLLADSPTHRIQGRFVFCVAVEALTLPILEASLSTTEVRLIYSVEADVVESLLTGLDGLNKERS